MKFLKYIIILSLISFVFEINFASSKLVIIHTNDTHSQIDPNENNKGGIARRKVLIDSIKATNKNVLLVDAGDAVQGTVYFNLFKGEIEQLLMNELGYDLRTIGNHEFDNGIEGLTDMINQSKSRFISSNYTFSDPIINGKISPYVIYNVCNKKIAFIALNVDLNGLVSANNYTGVEYNDVITTANEIAQHLKGNKKVDNIIALTHIGYDNDVKLASESQYIDIIIGGHSHDIIIPNDSNCNFTYKVPNINGDTVLIAQAGKAGLSIGEISIDFDNHTKESKIFTVDSTLDNKVDSNIISIIKPYREEVDKLMNSTIATSDIPLYNYEYPLQNLISDIVYFQAQKIYDHVDLSIVNKGGIRSSLPKGDISIGMIMAMLPFNNRIVIIEIKGSDLIEAFDIMATRGGDCISHNVDAVYDPTTGKCIKILINGRLINPDKTYHIATINYLAKGGDYMTPLTNGKQVAQSQKLLYDEIIDFLTAKGDLKINPSSKQRMRKMR